MLVVVALHFFFDSLHTSVVPQRFDRSLRIYPRLLSRCFEERIKYELEDGEGDGGQGMMVVLWHLS